MHPLNLLHPRAMLTLPWHCSCVTPQHQLNTLTPYLSVGEKGIINYTFLGEISELTAQTGLPFLLCKCLT